MNWLTRWRVNNLVDRAYYLEAEAEHIEELIGMCKAAPVHLLVQIARNRAKAIVLRRRSARMGGR